MTRLSVFFDISGQVTRQTAHDKFYTVGGVIIPTASETLIRDLCRGNIPKWKNATPESLSFMGATITDNDIYGAAIRVEKSNPACPILARLQGARSEEQSMRIIKLIVLLTLALALVGCVPDDALREKVANWQFVHWVEAWFWIFVEILWFLFKLMVVLLCFGGFLILFFLGLKNG